MWELELVTLLLQTLFPFAANNTMQVAEGGWIVPPLDQDEEVVHISSAQARKTWLQRMVLLSKVKVLTNLSRQLGLKRFKASINEIERLEDFTYLQSHLASVHGLIRVPLSKEKKLKMESNVMMSSGPNLWSWVSVEASHGGIIIKPVDDVVASHFFNASFNSSNELPTDVLIAQGMFHHDELTLLDRLFQLCGHYQLQMKPFVSVESIKANSSQEELLRIQSDYLRVMPLSGDWGYDGSMFIDFRGNRSYFHPKFNEMLSLHTEKINADITRFNDLLADVRPFI
jgi:hypothetical protein